MYETVRKIEKKAVERSEKKEKKVNKRKKKAEEREKEENESGNKNPDGKFPYSLPRVNHD